MGKTYAINMEDYRPYLVVEDSSTRLHLKEAPWRQSLLFLAVRILPMLYVGAMIFFLFNATDVPDHFKAVAIVMFAIPIIILLNFPLIIEVDITPIAISIKKNNVFGNKVEEIAIADIDKIVCRRMRGKRKGFLFSLVLKQAGTKRRMLSFNRFFMNDVKRQLLQDKLQTITRLHVENI